MYTCTIYEYVQYASTHMYTQTHMFVLVFINMHIYVIWRRPFSCIKLHECSVLHDLRKSYGLFLNKMLYVMF